MVLEAAYGWYWAADTLAELGAQRASGAPAGGEDVLLPAGEERPTRRRGPGRSAADGPAARGVDRPTGDPGAAGLGAAPGQAGRAALEPEVPGPRRARQRRHAGADERPVRRGRAATAGRGRGCCRSSPGPGWTRCCGSSTALDFEIELFAKLVAGRLRTDPGYRAIQHIPGVGPVLAAVFVAEIGDISRFPRPAQLASWAGLTPKHHESDTTVHRGRITKMGCGGRRRGLRLRSARVRGGCRGDRGWYRHSPGAVDIRLRGSRLRRSVPRADRPG